MYLPQSRRREPSVQTLCSPNIRPIFETLLLSGENNSFNSLRIETTAVAFTIKCAPLHHDGFYNMYI